MIDDFNRLSAGILRDDDVSSVVAKYPYFHAAQLLKLLKDCDGNPEKFLADSESVAILLPERAVLTDIYSRLLLDRISAESSRDSDDKSNDEGVEVMIDMIRHKLSDINKRFVDGKPSNSTYSLELDKKREVGLNLEQKRKSVLIDEFIKKSPSISRTSASISNSSEAYMKPEIDADNIVSETLAIIYTKQGNTEKAINTYLKLIELSPEKAEYFNLKIGELKNERGNKRQ